MRKRFCDFCEEEMEEEQPLQSGKVYRLEGFEEEGFRIVIKANKDICEDCFRSALVNDDWEILPLDEVCSRERGG